MRNPRILADIRAEQTRQLGGELASQAVGYLREVLVMPHAGNAGLYTRVAKFKLDAASEMLDSLIDITLGHVIDGEAAPVGAPERAECAGELGLEPV